jgi:hypothetical protein
VRLESAEDQADGPETSANAPFDLAEGPLIRIRLLRAGPRAHWLCVVMHHAVADDRSWVIFLRELGILYAAARAGSKPDLPGLPLQFADYAHWQSAWLRQEAAGLEQRWRELLINAPALSLLPTDLPREGEPAADCARATLRLDEALTSRLRATARDLEVPLFSLLLTGFQLLVRTMTGHERFVVGVPIANREDQRLASVMGDFADLVPVLLTAAGHSVREHAPGRPRLARPATAALREHRLRAQGGPARAPAARLPDRGELHRRG